MANEANRTTEPRTITLPSGATAAIREGKGRDLLQASRMAGGVKDGIRLSMAIIAVLTTIDGRPVVIEDVEDMSLFDLMTLMGEVMGNAPSSMSSISLLSGSTEGSGTMN